MEKGKEDDNRAGVLLSTESNRTAFISDTAVIVCVQQIQQEAVESLK